MLFQSFPWIESVEGKVCISASPGPSTGPGTWLTPQTLLSEAHTGGRHRPCSVPSPHAILRLSDSRGPASQPLTTPHPFHLHGSPGCCGPTPHTSCLPLGRPGGTVAPTSWHRRRGCQAPSGGGKLAVRVKLQTHPSQTPPRTPVRYLLFWRENSLFDPLLISRRPGQKVRGKDSVQAPLPGYYVTLGRLPSLPQPVPSVVFGTDITCPV